MPDVARTSKEFTDTGIIEAIRILTDIVRKKEMITNVSIPGERVNFDQFRMADALI
jgi:hypothetical protein